MINGGQISCDCSMKLIDILKDLMWLGRVGVDFVLDRRFSM